MNVFVQKGFLTIPEATLRLADPSQSDREVALKEAREQLHEGLCGGSVKYVIQMQTGEHRVPPPDIWRSSNSLNWIVDGEVFVPDGTALRMPFGPYVPGLPDDVNFVEMDGGTYAIFLIVEDSLERFRGRVAWAEKIEKLGSTLGDTKSNSRAIFRNETEEMRSLNLGQDARAATKNALTRGSDVRFWGEADMPRLPVTYRSGANDP